MNKFLIIAGVFLLVSLFNVVNVFVSGSGISLVMGAVWLGASAYVYIQYRKMKYKAENESAQEAPQEEQV